MSFNNLSQFQSTSFSIPRYSDKELVAKLEAMVNEGNYKTEKTIYIFTFSNQSAEFAGGEKDTRLREVLDIETISIRQIDFQLSGWLKVSVVREWDNQVRKLNGNQDKIDIGPIGQGNTQHTIVNFAKAIALARKHFHAVDTKPFMDFFDESTRQLYQSREQDLQRLERMQETFFDNLQQFSLEQQQKQQEFQRKVEEQYHESQRSLEEKHQQKLSLVEARETELKKIRADIDERENRQARRDIYKELKAKLEARNKSFQLTEGTKNLRVNVRWFSIILLVFFASRFIYCFYRNVVNNDPQINWLAVAS